MGVVCSRWVAAKAGRQASKSNPQLIDLGLVTHGVRTTPCPPAQLTD